MLSSLPALPVPSWLEACSGHPLPQALPIRDLLRGSVYYPSSRFDGTPVRLLGGNAHSFVYVDYGVTENELVRNVGGAPFKGYGLLGSRSVTSNELTPDGWTPRLPPLGPRDRPNPHRSMGRPFAHWMVFEREVGFGESHGPQRFSLLYVGGDGLATYQALYHEQAVAPLAVCIIQPGEGFGGNWAVLGDRRGAFANLVLDHRADLRPQLLLCGGWSDSPSSYRPAAWPEFTAEIACERQDADGSGPRGWIVAYRRPTE